MRGEQQAIASIQALGVVITLRPGLDVTGNEQGFVGDAGDSAFGFNLLQVPAEVALADASFAELQPDFQGRGLDGRLDSVTFQFGLVLFDVIDKVRVHAVGQ